MPRGYQQLGTVLLVRLPDELRPYFSVIGESWQEVLGARTVLRPRGPVEGDWRLPSVDVIAGDDAETEVLEHGIRYRFDAEKVLFSRGNKIERALAGRLVRPGETVIDLFAGIGYFALPAAVHGHAQTVIACEANPVSFRYLTENARRNRVEHIIRPVAGDNRTVPLPEGTADRIFLGYLPSSLPWIERALPLLRKKGGTMHVHLLADVRGGRERARDAVLAEVERGGGRVARIDSRKVKPYGPGRSHVVVDVSIGP
jgi:tRNA wybutosine-synthesizing protein 2